ncbi:hypothetical protein [Paenibacillus herberti]|uniref:Uncharacterized protein n=1 Tax=Paenibacillus herberti TaxID=1619309 RepID=A0A229NVF9_9BACL|nr:hypothetical protein [Paenibacillus herberti]OXM13896.1 hypothetical protein CGZ75_12845 [Paenibacillus herberti]
MKRKRKAANFWFKLVVKTPLISIMLTLTIGLFVYYSLFVYQIDREFAADGSFSQSESGSYTLTLETNEAIGEETVTQIYWYSGARKYRAAFQAVIVKEGGATIIALPDSNEVITEFGVSDTLADELVKGSIVVGKERVIDKIK